MINKEQQVIQMLETIDILAKIAEISPDNLSLLNYKETIQNLTVPFEEKFNENLIYTV